MFLPGVQIDITSLSHLMPMHILIGEDGQMMAAGPTTRRVAGHLVGRRFFDCFEIRRPRGISDLDTLDAMAGRTLHLQLLGEKPTSFRAVGVAARRDGARHLLNLVGLSGFEDKRPSELSGGMRQRASLCRSIVHKPEVLILDEPFGALDAFTREDLWQTMHAVRKEEQTTCLLITHDLREAVFLADQVIVLSGRPATVQHVMDIDLGDARTLDDLYTPESAERLNILRHQIEIAQGRNKAD